MSKRIIVTYASRTGFTVGVAEAIGKTLAEHDFPVDVTPMIEIDDLSLYDSVIAGSAIQNKQWLPEAMQFIQRHRLVLTQKPCAVFLVCMTLAMPNNPYQAEVANWLQPVRAIVKPASEGLFAGGLDIRRIPSLSDRLKFRISVLAKVWSEGDHRDWIAIRRWTENIVPLMNP